MSSPNHPMDYEELEFLLPTLNSYPDKVPDLAELLDSLRVAAELLALSPEPVTETSLIHLSPDRKTACLTPVGKGIRMGRAPDCDICFPNHREVSRAHFSVELFEDQYLLKDLSSSNGTTIQGKGVCEEPRLLADGDLITAGGFVFLFVRRYAA